MTEITEYITNDVKAIDSLDSIAAVQDFFSDLHSSHFPVLEEEFTLVVSHLRILKL
jgi:hypothetical protein